jgi:GNAT superfamily N-acetyltransferase
MVQMMQKQAVSIRTEDDDAIEAFLAKRIYEYNAEATGCFDAQSFHAVHRNERGDIEAGVCGYTWGGCCYVSYLWVLAALRGTGLGTALVEAVELHARAKQCTVVILSSHSFQAPQFYINRGYRKQCEIRDHPAGFSNVVLTKRL